MVFESSPNIFTRMVTPQSLNDLSYKAWLFRIAVTMLMQELIYFPPGMPMLDLTPLELKGELLHQKRREPLRTLFSIRHLFV